MTTSRNIFLADLVAAFHLLVVLFVIFAPFSNVPYILVLHITFGISLLVHWYFNDNTCSLTVLESSLRGIPRDTTFTYQFIAPVYDISLTSWRKLTFYATVALMAISAYRLFNHDAWKKCKDVLYSKTSSKSVDTLQRYAKCMQIIFG